MRYKLINPLPNCTVGDIAVRGEKEFYWELSKKHVPYFFAPHNAKDWWEEIVEKDWEILEFKYIGSNCMYSLKDGLYDGIPLYSLLHSGICVDTGSMLIHKVKCISTGEIFTVEDNTNKGKIKRFYIISDTMIVDIVNKKECCHLHELKHAKIPIFSTLDGVDIYDGQPYVYIDSDNNIKNIKKADKNSGRLAGYMYFSTKEAAQEYLIQNSKTYLLLAQKH